MLSNCSSHVTVMHHQVCNGKLAGRLQPFGVRVIGVKQSPWTNEIQYNGVEKRGSWSQLHAFAAEADIVILTCTQTAATRGMVDAAFLAACKAGVIIINMARGEFSPQPKELVPTLPTWLLLLSQYALLPAKMALLRRRPVGLRCCERRPGEQQDWCSWSGRPVAGAHRP